MRKTNTTGICEIQRKILAVWENKYENAAL